MRAEADRRLNTAGFHSSPHLLAVVTLDGKLKVVNESWSRVLGYGLDELVGRPLSKFVEDGDRAKVLKLINPKIIATDPASIEIALICKDRSYRAFVWNRRRVAAEEAMFITGQDITEKKKLEVTASLNLYELYAQARRTNKRPAE